MKIYNRSGPDGGPQQHPGNSASGALRLQRNPSNLVTKQLTDLSVLALSAVVTVVSIV